MDFDPDLEWRDVRDTGFNAHIGPIRLATVSDREWAFHLDLDQRHINFGGVCHGGVLMSLADTGMGASASIAAGRAACATIAFNADFVAAVKIGHVLHGRARLVRRVRDLCFMETELWSNGRQVLRAAGIWKELTKGRG